MWCAPIILAYREPESGSRTYKGKGRWCNKKAVSRFNVELQPCGNLQVRCLLKAIRKISRFMWAYIRGGIQVS